MGAVKVNVAAAAPALILICMHLVQLVSAAGTGGLPARSRRLLSGVDVANPDVVAYWNAKLGNVALPEAELVSRLSPQDVARFYQAITSKSLLNSTQDSLAATFCSAAGLVCTYDWSTYRKSVPAQVTDSSKPFEGHSWDDEPEAQAQAVVDSSKPFEGHSWDDEPEARAVVDSAKPFEGHSWDDEPEAKPLKAVGSLLYTETELERARTVYFLAKDIGTLGTPGAKLSTVPGQHFTKSLSSVTGAYLPRQLSSALGALQPAEFLRALRTPAASAWAATLASTVKLCDQYKGLLHIETRACARSLEDVADFVALQLGSQVEEGLAVEITGYLELKSCAAAGSLEVVKVEKRSATNRGQVLCHDMGSFAYKLRACHHLLATDLYSVTLKSSVEPGVSITNLVACHTETKTFRPDHIAFQALGIKPGDGGVCHYTMPGVTAFY